MIRTSLAAMPRRGVVFAAKAVVFGVIALAVGLVTSFASYFVGQAILSAQHINSTIGQPVCPARGTAALQLLRRRRIDRARPGASLPPAPETPFT